MTASPETGYLEVYVRVGDTKYMVGVNPDSGASVCYGGGGVFQCFP